MKRVLMLSTVASLQDQFNMANIRMLRNLHCDVHVACNFVQGNNTSPQRIAVFQNELAALGVTCHQIDFARSPFHLLQNHRAYQQLKAVLRADTFDCIHCHTPVGGIYGRKAATAFQIPVIYTAHGFHFYEGAPVSNWKYYVAEKHYARYTDKLLVINQEDYARAKKFPIRGNVEYVQGVGLKPAPEKDPDFDMRKAYGIPADHKVVVSVGELTEGKNNEVMLRAMDRFRRKKLTYLICGTGAMEEHLRTVVREMHLDGQVVFAGYCEKIPDVLLQADCFAFPSKREGLPVAMMEAMRAGLPVLALDIRGNHDLISDGEGGFLFEEGNASDYVKGLSFFLDYPEEAKRMGEWNKKRVQDFSIDLVEEKMRRIYAEAESGELK